MSSQRDRAPGPGGVAGRARRVVVGGVIVVAALALVLPALAADPSSRPSGSPRPSKAPKVEVTIDGVVGTTTAPDGEVEYTLRAGATTYELDAGPPWFYRDGHPLARYVGRSVTVVGERREGSTEIDVFSVDGQRIREPGKPPWAGGWMRVGERHPGWSAEKARRLRELFGDCFPPGHCKHRPSPSPSR